MSIVISVAFFVLGLVIGSMAVSLAQLEKRRESNDRIREKLVDRFVANGKSIMVSTTISEYTDDGEDEEGSMTDFLSMHERN